MALNNLFTVTYFCRVWCPLQNILKPLKQVLTNCQESLLTILFPFQPKKVKNVSYDAFGTKEGKVHMQRQDYSKLQTRKMKGLKRQLNTKGKPQDKIKRKKTGWQCELNLFQLDFTIVLKVDISITICGSIIINKIHSRYWTQIISVKPSLYYKIQC